MDWKLLIALALNVGMVACELIALLNIKRKVELFKYYTYLQNLLSLVVSAVFCVFLARQLFGQQDMPQFARGLRYIATCGLVATTVIYLLFMARSHNIITQDDVLRISPAATNVLLHYLCPALSLTSFLAFERTLPLTNDIWTAIVNLPSVLYWIVYVALTATKTWKDPYDFGNDNKKQNKFVQALTFVAIPLSFVVVCFALWNWK